VSHNRPSQQYLDRLRERYAQATKKVRQQILDEFVATTGYHRKHAIALLRGKRRRRDRTKPIRHLLRLSMAAISEPNTDRPDK
jgi:hypothetical protein